MGGPEAGATAAAGAGTLSGFGSGSSQGTASRVMAEEQGLVPQVQAGSEA